MNPISTSTAYQNSLAQILNAENREMTAQQQVSSTKLGDSLSGFGNSTDAIVAAQSVQTRVTGLISQLNQNTTELTFQQGALTSLPSIAQQLQTTLTNADGDGSGTDLMSQVQSLFSQAVTALNTQYNGQYVFSGGATSTQPFTATQLSDLTTQPDVSSFFQNGSLAPVTRIDDNTTIQSGFTASDVGSALMTAFQSLAQFQQSAGSLTGNLTSAQQSSLESIMSSLSAVTSSTTATAAQGGDIQNQVAAALKTQTARQNTLTTVIGNMTDADMAAASSSLVQAQTSFQAAAEVFNTLQGMSLLNYLSPPTGA